MKFGTPPDRGKCQRQKPVVMPHIKQVAEQFGNMSIAFGYPPGFPWPIRSRVRQALWDHRKALAAGQCVAVPLTGSEVLYAGPDGWQVTKE